MNIDKIVTISELSKLHPDTFPPNRVRYLCNRRTQNGFDSCLSSIGQKLYVNLDDLELWLESRRLKYRGDLE